MAINVGNLVVKGKEPEVRTPPPPANPSSLNVGKLVVINQPPEPTVSGVIERPSLPVDDNRPIFNSLIDNKESSRYILDMMK